MTARDWKILLIDDDPGIRKVLTLSLEDAGYRVISAPDGKTGLELCEAESPQIVITDIQMPIMNGLEVLQRVKALDPDREVIVITAFTDTESAIKALQLDASDFITKPLSDDALMVALKRAQERYTTRRELRDYTAILEEKWMQTSEELARTFHFQRMLIESSIDGIVACDSASKVMIFNRSMEQMLGYERDEVVGRMLLDGFFAPGEGEKFYAKLSSEECGGKNRLFLCELYLLRKGGTKIPCQVSAAVLVEGGREMGIVGFFRDLREIRQMAQEFEDQARLLHQDKMISLGKLASSVVHEINNPISGMLNYAHLMQKVLKRGLTTPEAAEKFAGYLELMESELSRCSKIVSNLLAFSRKSKIEFEPVQVNDLLARSLALSAHKLAMQNVAVKTGFDPRAPEILGDFNQLQQCIINLIFNAIDAMPEGGTLTLESELHPASKVVEIRVGDTGCGIREEDIPYIFDPFFTTKKEGKGVGLGLSTTYGIVDRHKGTICVSSKPGRGTLFTIKLPLKTDRSAAGAPAGRL